MARPGACYLYSEDGVGPGADKPLSVKPLKTSYNLLCSYSSLTARVTLLTFNTVFWYCLLINSDNCPTFGWSSFKMTFPLFLDFFDGNSSSPLRNYKCFLFQSDVSLVFSYRDRLCLSLQQPFQLSPVLKCKVSQF